MYSNHPISHHRTPAGEKFIIVPAPRFLGCTVDAEGKLTALKYPDHHYLSETGYKLYTDLKGLNIEDVERYQPDFILYKLGDGTLLKANQEAIAKAGGATNSATSYGAKCLKHLIGDLEIAEMPEIEEYPIFDLSNL